MHELSLVNALHETLEQLAREQPFSRVQRLHLALGALACVDRDTLLWCIESTAPGTLLENADIVTTTEAAQAHCCACGRESAPDSLAAPCPHCGTHDLRWLAGRDMRIVSVDVLPLE